MADAIYHFVWGDFCDNYLEETKPLLSAKESETATVAAWAFDQILVMLHPLMPFVTEELWHGMGKRPYDLIVAKWPDPQAEVDAEAKAVLEQAITANAAIQSARAEVGVPPGTKLDVWAYPETPIAEKAITLQMDSLKRRARLDDVQVKRVPKNYVLKAEPGTFTVVGGEVTFKITAGDDVDLDAYKARLLKNLEAAEKERDSLAQRLANPNFTERAKPEAVEKARADHEAKSAEAERLRAALERLG
jgi:valyl-tRNA synthetase